MFGPLGALVLADKLGPECVFRVHAYDYENIGLFALFVTQFVTR